MVINEKWIAAFAVNDTKNDRVLRIYNKFFDHEPTEKDLLDEITSGTSRVFPGKTCSVDVIGWQRLRVGEEKK